MKVLSSATALHTVSNNKKMFTQHARE